MKELYLDALIEIQCTPSVRITPDEPLESEEEIEFETEEEEERTVQTCNDNNNNNNNVIPKNQHDEESQKFQGILINPVPRK